MRDRHPGVSALDLRESPKLYGNPGAAGRPIRIMRIITRLNIGGPSYQAIYLSERLKEPEFSSALVTGHVGPAEGSMEPLALERGIPFTRVSGLGREISLKTDGLTAVRLYREIRRFRPDIVHTHLAKAGAVGRLAARAARVPAIVHTYHGHVFHGYFSRRKTEAFIRIERKLGRWTDRIIVLSESQKAEILARGVGRPEQMEVVPLGLELEPFLGCAAERGAVRSELGIAPDAPVVGIVARLVPIKAHDLFLQAARTVADRLPGAHFLVVGDGELRQDLERTAAEARLQVISYSEEQPARRTAVSGAGTVHFLGFRQDLTKLYADMDAVVVCSHNEGMPVTIIEALAAERPVVGTDVGAIRGLLKDGEAGWVVPPGDSAALAAAVLEALFEPGLARRRAFVGREHVYPHLSIARLEQDLRRIYRSLVDAKLGVRLPAREAYPV